MKNILIMLLLMLTLMVSGQNKEIIKFKTNKYGVETKVSGAWEGFSEWNLIEDTASIIIQDNKRILFHTKGSISTYDIFDHTTGEEEVISFTKFFTIDDKGDECTVILTTEEDENGEPWTIMYFYYKETKVVYSLH